MVLRGKTQTDMSQLKFGIKRKRLRNLSKNEEVPLPGQHLLEFFFAVYSQRVEKKTEYLVEFRFLKSAKVKTSFWLKY